MTKSKAKILLVEDDFHEAEYIKSAVMLLGFSVIGIATTGPMAIDLVKREPPDLVLMDILLEGKMDGIQTAEAIQELHDIPVIYLTAYDEDELFQRARITEPFGYLLKPFSERELRSTIEIALYKHLTEKKLKESEKRYAEIFNALTDAFLLIDEDGKILEANQHVCQMYGYSYSELLLLSLMELNLADYHSLILEQIQHAGEFCGEMSFESQGIRKNGACFYVEIKGAPFIYQGQEAFLLILRDITERKEAENTLSVYHDRLEELVEERTTELIQANTQLRKEILERKHTEDALAKEQNLLRTLIDNLPDYIFVKDLEGRFVLNNMAHARLLGAGSPEELLGKKDSDFFSPEFTAQYNSSDQKILRYGQSLLNEEESTIDQEGRRQYILTTKVPLRDNQGNMLGIIALCRDITERKRTEIELQNSEALLRATLESTADGILVVNKQGGITHSNSRFAEMWYIPEDLLVTKEDHALLQHVSEQLSTPQDFLVKIQELYETSEESHDILTFKDGRVFERYSCPLIHEGRIDGRVWSFRDITAYKKSEAELQNYRDHLEELVEERTAELMREIQERKRAEQVVHEMEQRYELAVAATNVGVWDWDLETSEVYLEAHLKRMLGYDQDEISNEFSSWIELVHPIDRPHVIAQANAHLEGKTDIYHIEHRMIHKNGSARWIATRGKAFYDEQGKAIRLIGTHTDITDHKQMEQASQASAQRLQTVIETVGDGITLSDDRGNFEIFNSEMEDITGYTKEEANASENFLALLYPDFNEGHKAFAGMQDVYHNGKLRDVETTIRTKSGQMKTLLVSTSSVPSFEGNHFLSAYHDITRRKQAEKELHAAKEAAEAANRAKSEFLANMSHELRTPLNAVLGYTQILRQEQSLTDRQLQAIDIIHRSGEHLLLLINDILDLSKIEARKLELVINDFALADFLQGIVDITRIRAHQKGIRFEYNAEGLPVIVQADEKRLRQVLLNLLSNAVKFTNAGSVSFRVSVISRSYQKAVIRFEVNDTGTGIATDKLDQIFLPFYQIDKSLSHTEGTGLGLAISQRLVDMMRGRLQVSSTEGSGSRFWCDLPLSEVAASAKKGEHSETDISRVVGFRGAPQRILIADDTEENRALLQAFLVPLGFEVIEAEDGHDALEKIHTYAPDLVLLDLIMPNKNGFEVVRTIRETPELQHMLVIAISASAFSRTKRESLAAGCNDFLSKPFQLKGLLKILHTHLPIEWIYDEPPHEVTENVVQAIPPTPQDVRRLLEFATTGHVKKFLVCLESIERQQGQESAFTAQVRQLAKSFQMNQLCQFLEESVREE